MPRDDPAPRTASRTDPAARWLGLRVVLWRLRLPLAALCAGLAVTAVVARLTPAAPATVRVAVAARTLAAGTVLAAGDIAVRDVPVALVPTALVPSALLPTAQQPATGPTASGAVSDAPEPQPIDDLVGGRLAVDAPAGLPLVPGLLVDAAAEPPPGTVVVPVRFADPALTALLAPGTRVDVVVSSAVDGVPPEQVARSAVVLARTGSAATGAGPTAADGAGSGIGSGAGSGSADGTTDGSGAGSADGTDDGPVLLAVTPDEAVALSGAAASGVLSAVLVG
ncbi:MAG TPA: SAF domain-containing protein [Cellulomonas sp.]